MSIPHDELTRHAERWLREDCNCILVLTEATKGPRHKGERPDAIGWTRPYVESIVCESKVSIEDLRRDAEKEHRAFGMGAYRYIVAQRYVFEAFQVPDGWGLLEYDPDTGQMLETRKAPAWKVVNHVAEKRLLIKAVYDSKRGGGDAEAGRRANNGHIPKHYHNAIERYVRKFGDCRATEVVNALGIQPKQRAGTVAKHLANDAKAGLIKGVRADGCPALLFPSDER